jgi:hypothetical protein
MPKKKSKESEEEFDIEELNELDKLKFDKDVLSEEDKAGQDEEPKEDEESELEEDLELNLENLEFNQFMQSSEPSGDRAPVLERIAGSQPRPVFVGGIPQTPFTVPGEEEKTDEFKYVPGRTGNDEPKYIAPDSRISTELTPVDLMKVGRRQTGMIPQVDQETFFMHSEPHSQIESSTPERGWKAERIDTEKAGRKDVFEENDAKYKNYKPKLPKSY